MTNVETLLAQLDADIKAVQRDLKTHRGSRYVGPGADPAVVKHIASGGSVKFGTGEPVDYGDGDFSLKGRTVEPGDGGRLGGSLAKALWDIAQHRTEHLTPLWAEKALAESTDSAGGFLLAPELAHDVMMLIRNRVAVTSMPITTVQPRSKLYELVGLSTTPTQASAAWLAENASIPASAQSFSVAAQMVPRPLGSLIAISNRLLADAISENPLAAGGAEDVIQRDLADLMAVSLDAALLQGDSAGPAPKGLLRLTGTTPLPAGTIATNGSQITYPILVAIVSALRTASLPFSSPGWIFNARTLESLQTLTDSLGDPLLAKNGLLTVDASGSGGSLLGFPFRVTNAIPSNQTFGTASTTSTIIFASDWSEAYLGDWQAFALDSSQEATYDATGSGTWVSAFQSLQTVFRATLWADFTVRRPAAFVLAGGILP